MAMTKNPITISPDAPIIDAVQILYSKKIGGLLAVEDGELKGILTVSDMLGLLSELLTGSDKSKSMTGGS
jgi:CBS domain-containing protein